MIKTVGVVGAGQMGNGIAHLCALTGAQVKLMDIDPAAIEAALTLISSNMDRQIKRGTINETMKHDSLARIETGTGFEIFKECDIVIEAATEDEETKRKIFRDCIPHISEACILATNTSSISITRLAANTDRPDRFCGVHFLKPANAMPLVEMIRGLATSEETFETCLNFVEKQLGKTTAVSEDFPAFIVNRILLPMVNEAIYTLYEGVGNVTAIDTAMKLGTKHPLGPLELADFIGLDTCLAILNTLHHELADNKYRPCPLLVKYVEAGWLGRKSGRGFYDYSEDTPRPTR
ncbi:3-hydroxybutyryl-CoA dehydrogenase [Curvivirga aplysinae]|uniref:3-hydroxybutyryl-CoA dehydrogenase n=1 Tax=Curvivirga aplysinae TaxID=2529852 RepID=UPI0012BCF520|nr:3-hydroxybutyryl-CoA dehydrogenase [Curvivirga aplysinae]MTI08812.1 3-hydroxybutyryl-CoA dehydrogenase [Curvivirga aplysinae]